MWWMVFIFYGWYSPCTHNKSIKYTIEDANLENETLFVNYKYLNYGWPSECYTCELLCGKHVSDPYFLKTPLSGCAGIFHSFAITATAFAMLRSFRSDVKNLSNIPHCSKWCCLLQLLKSSQAGFATPIPRCQLE